MARAGSIVILNGASSSGKSTLAQAFAAQRAARGEPWLVIGIDDFLARLPEEWFSVGDHHGPWAGDGVWFERRGEETHVVLGAVGARLMTAYHETVATIARAGMNVVVDEVVLSEAMWLDWQRALAGLDATWVAVQCAVDVVAAREAERGDRQPGLARAQSRTVHLHPTYAIRVDTSHDPVDTIVDTLDAGLG